METVVRRMYSRYTEGCIAIDVLSEGERFNVHFESGVEKVEGKRALLERLGVQGYSYDRYFRIMSVRANRVPPLGGGKGVSESVIPLEASVEASLEASSESSSLNRGGGIDVGSKWLDIKRLCLGGYGQLIHRYGLDVEEVLQEVYMGILIRNGGDGAWDSAKSSFGHYIHMVCGCVILNFISRRKRIYKHDRALRKELQEISRSGFGTYIP